MLQETDLSITDIQQDQIFLVSNVQLQLVTAIRENDLAKATKITKLLNEQLAVLKTITDMMGLNEFPEPAYEHNPVLQIPVPSPRETVEVPVEETVKIEDELNPPYVTEHYRMYTVPPLEGPAVAPTSADIVEVPAHQQIMPTGTVNNRQSYSVMYNDHLADQTYSWPDKWAGPEGAERTQT